jgi:hypothetical protein
MIDAMLNKKMRDTLSIFIRVWMSEQVDFD